MAGKKAVDADVFIKVRPMYASAIANETPSVPFGLGAVGKTRIPVKRYRDCTTIDYVNG